MSEELTESLLVTAKQISDRRILPFAVRSIRRMDASGKMPRAVSVGGKKCCKLADLEQWVKLGCPGRTEFEARVQAENGRS